jgi:23S rRNA (pseudouridine1915-N3)-methyltransferase
MSVKILCIGKTADSYLEQGMNVYKKRLNKYGGIRWIELPDVSKKKFSSENSLKLLESKIFLKEIQPNDYVIGLDEKGSQFKSRDFASKWNELTVGHSNLVVLVGGAYGYHEELYSRMDSLISMSKMTFSHQLVRLLFLEQLYRAYTILNGEPYHND